MLYEGVYYGISGSNGDFDLMASNDLFTWQPVNTPQGNVEAVSNLDGTLRLAVSSSETAVFVFDFDPVTMQWDESFGAEPVISGADLGLGAEIYDVELGIGGAAVVAGFPDSDVAMNDVLALVPFGGDPVDVPIPSPWNGKVSPHEDGFLVNSLLVASDPEGAGVRIVSFDGQQTMPVAPAPESIVSIRALPSGELLGVNTLGSGETSAIVVSEDPYENWVPIAEAPADEGCGSRFGASADGELLLYYPYCDGHVWVSERGGEWVRSENVGLGDADSNVDAIDVIDGYAILHTYEGTVSVELPR